MSSIKKRQHYVWRQYLRPWAQTENIWTYFKELNKVEYPGLMGVGQEKYFYKLVTFTQEEEEFLRKFIEHTSHPTVKPLCMDFLEMFTYHYKLQKQLDDNTNSKIDRKKVQAEIDKLEINMMEDAHCKFESFGNKLIACRNIKDLQFLENPDDLNETVIFLCVQYFRTRGMKKAVLKRYRGAELERVEKFWNIISICFALTLARNIALDKNLRFILFENQTGTAFITGDQPIFNILNDKVDENGNVKEFEIFYPITPKHAISGRFDEKQKDRCIDAVINADMVKYFNGKVFDNSDYFVFANNEDQLRVYATP